CPTAPAMRNHAGEKFRRFPVAHPGGRPLWERDFPPRSLPTNRSFLRPMACARRPRLGGTRKQSLGDEWGCAGAGSSWKTLAGRASGRPPLDQRLGLLAQVRQFQALIPGKLASPRALTGRLREFLIDPSRGLPEPGPRLVGVPQVMVGHGQEEP